MSEESVVWERPQGPFRLEVELEGNVIAASSWQTVDFFLTKQDAIDYANSGYVGYNCRIVEIS